MIRTAMVFGMLVITAAAAAAAQQDNPHAEIAKTLDGPEMLGSADVRMLGFNLYKAELWTEQKAPFDFEQPFALSLTYKRSFSAGQLSRSSIREMARIEDRPQRELAAFGPVLEDCFDNVEPGDRITGMSDGVGAAQFFVNGQQSCEIEDPDFSNSFFAIWLGDQTRDRRSRARLLGDNK